MFFEKKFRAFLKEKEYAVVEVETVNFRESCVEYLDKQCNHIIEAFKNLVLSEYSSFIDTKGTEIAVGDIVKMNESLYEIEIDRECFIMLPINNLEEKKNQISYYLDDELCEIIGNKFENKELYC